MSNFPNLIIGLSEEIARTLTALRAEEHFPHQGPDQSDYRIKALRANLVQLREIRATLEEIAATPTHGGY